MTSDGRYVSKELCFLIGQHKIGLLSNTICIDVTIINICSARGFAICCMNASGKKRRVLLGKQTQILNTCLFLMPAVISKVVSSFRIFSYYSNVPDCREKNEKYKVLEKYSFSVYIKKTEFLWYTGNTIIKERLKIKFLLKLIASLHLFKSNFTYVAQSKFKKLS